MEVSGTHILNDMWKLKEMKYMMYLFGLWNAHVDSVIFVGPVWQV